MGKATTKDQLRATAERGQGYAAEVAMAAAAAIDALATSLFTGQVCVQMQTASGVDLCARDGQEIVAWRTLTGTDTDSANTINAAVAALSATIDAHRRDYVATAKELVTAISAR